LSGRGAGAANSGLTLFEVVVVIALVAFVYSVAIPQFSLKSGAEAATKVGRLAEDVRSAFDLAVLTGRPYRLVFELNSGRYWLETTDRPDFLLGDDKAQSDPTAEEEADLEAAAESAFLEFESLAGEPIVDPDTRTEFMPVSPVVQAKTRLLRPKWKRVETLEWRERSLGPYMMIKEMQAEHHATKQSVVDLPENGRAFLYFLPGGYVEKAWMIVSYKRGEREPDDSMVPYTFKTSPWSGTLDTIGTGEESAVTFD
jgi:type II secretory pathway pseudopilin PulG